ncbi:hypothetical protein CRE_24144 [Caenorhabditis remanei]|uniref:Uncharacterized protein n=1 Tax=Caenorhabditis remanei TaxID=31234 RepID=E3N468_CAERE|nr:hypothetical protein CRE_24144 [Caenorhabditis remanei]
MWHFSAKSALLLLLVLVATVASQYSTEEGEMIGAARSKRSYYGGYDMYGLVSSPIIATQPSQYPQPIASSNYPDVPGNANYIPTHRQAPPPRQVIHVDSSPRDSEISRVMVPGDQVIYSAEDRYYTSSTAPATAHRPDAYNVSRY